MTDERVELAERHAVSPVTARGRALLVAGLAVTLAAIVLISWWPRPVDGEVLEVIERVVPGIRNAVVDSPVYGPAEVIGNVLLYVPLGLAVAALGGLRGGVRGGRAWVAVTAAVVAGLLLSAVAESGQALWLPQRYPTGVDVIANAVGALLGGVVARAARRPARLSAPR